MPEPLGGSGLDARLRALIEGGGPIPLSDYIALANGHYYATRDPLGAAGDFTTAPEISQMFGELVGLALADVWARAGRPPVAYVELGPGRGTLAADALRAMARAGLTPPVHLVETSPVLRAAQSARIPHAVHHDTIDTLPADTALLIAANEFFDALPIRQFARLGDGWRERLIGLDAAGALGWVPGAQDYGAAIPPALRAAASGAVVETSPASVAIMTALAERLAARGGAMLAIDYGHASTGIGDTLQAVERHGYADPLGRPGERDLTAHVDFDALAQAAQRAGAAVHGPAEQGAWLTALGIDARAATLARAAPARAADIATARARLVETDQMGRLFKVIGITAPHWPAPAALARREEPSA